jgi:signal transduction histidine kinase
VVRAHGGSVEAENRAQGGARLSITWPLHTENAMAAHKPLASING